MQEQPHYLHLKYKGLFQPYSWPFYSSIITADKFICLNCTLPSSAIIADKYLSAFKRSWTLGFLQNHVWSDQRILYSPWICFRRVGFYFCYSSWSSIELQSLTARPIPPALPAQESGNLLTWLCKKHWPSISHSRSLSIETFLTLWRHQQPFSEFVRSVSATPKRKTLDQEILTQTCYNVLSVSMTKCTHQPGG